MHRIYGRRVGTIVAAILACVFIAAAVLQSTSCSIVSSKAAPDSRRGAGGDNSEQTASRTDTFTPNPYLSRLMIAEQRESREQYRRLAEGQIKRFVVSTVTTLPGRYVVHMEADLVGIGMEPFDVIFVRSGGGYFLLATTQGSPLAVISGIGPEELALGDSMQRQERRYQKGIKDLIANRIAYVDIVSVTPELDSSVLEAVFHMRDGTTQPATIQMRHLNGFWYVTSLRTTA